MSPDPASAPSLVKPLFQVTLQSVVEIIRFVRQGLLPFGELRQFLYFGLFTEKAQFPIGLDDLNQHSLDLRFQDPNVYAVGGENRLCIPLRKIDPCEAP